MGQANSSNSAANNFLALALIGAFFVFMYLLLGSAICKLPDNKETQKKNEYAECIKNEGKTEYSCLEFFNPPYNQPIREQTSESDTRKYGGWAKQLLCETKASDIAIAFLTYCLVLVGGWQAYWLKQTVDTTGTAAEKQASDMKDAIAAANNSASAAVTSNQIAVTNSEQQLRAYVTTSGINVVTHRGLGRMGAYGEMVEGPIHTYGLATILRNGGQTPAINVTINVSSQRLPKELNTSYNFSDSKLFGHGLIGPDSETHTPVIRITAPELEQTDKTHEWYFWGWVEYDDIFSGTIRHRTEFCFEIIFERLPQTNEPWLTFIPYSRFNAADGDCLRPIDPTTNKSGS